MVAGLLIPDLPVAIIGLLKADPDVAGLVGPRISMAFPEGRRSWDMKNVNAILVRPRGGPAPDLYDDRRMSRLDLNFYGAGETPNVRRRMARLVWRTAEPVLCPPPNSGLPMGGPNPTLQIIIHWIRPEMGEPFVAPDPQTDWDRCVMPYMVSWSRLRMT